MKSYGHVLVSHTADFYEQMDFKNASTEQGEFFFAQAKKTLKNMTGKDLTKDEPLAQVLIRLGFAAHKRLQRGPQTLSSCNRRIRDAFQGDSFTRWIGNQCRRPNHCILCKAHKFKELIISPSMFKPDETDAFLENLKHWGYQENIRKNIYQAPFRMFFAFCPLKNFRRLKSEICFPFVSLLIFVKLNRMRNKETTKKQE